MTLSVDYSKCDGKEACGKCTEISDLMPGHVAVNAWVMVEQIGTYTALMECCPNGAINLR